MCEQESIQILTFLFNYVWKKIMVDSGAVERNHTERFQKHITGFFSVLTYCNFRVLWEDQDINVGTIHQSYSDFMSFPCTHLHIYMYLVLCSCMAYVDCVTTPTSRYRQVHHSKDSSCCLYRCTTSVFNHVACSQLLKISSLFFIIIILSFH